MPGWRTFAVLGALAGLSGVVFAALGSHLGGGIGNSEDWRAWQSAGLIHLVHGIAVLALALWLRINNSRLVLLAAVAMLLGIGLFSGSSYVRVLTGSEGTGGLAPIGGFCLLAGWVLVIAAAVVSDREPV